MEYNTFARLNEPQEWDVKYSKPSALLTFGGTVDDDEWDPSPDTMEDFILSFKREHSDGDSSESDSIDGGVERHSVDDDSDDDDTIIPDIVEDDDNDMDDDIDNIDDMDGADIIADDALEPDIVPDVVDDTTGNSKKVKPVDPGRKSETDDETAIDGAGEFDNINLLLERYQKSK
jgi:hypothetical protein